MKEAGVYGLSVPFGTNDLMATRFLNFYVRSGGGSLLTKDLKADLTSQLAQDGIKYWVKMYKEISPQDSLNFNVLQQATLFYQGKTAFDFNSGFHIGGINANSPQLLIRLMLILFQKSKNLIRNKELKPQTFQWLFGKIQNTQKLLKHS